MGNIYYDNIQATNAKRFSKTKQLIELKVFNHCEKIVRENKYALCQNSRDLINR